MPRSRMDVLTENEIDTIVSGSKLAAKYNQVIDKPSGYEILTEKLNSAAASKPEEISKKSVQPEESTLEKVVNNPLVKSMMHTVGNTIVRSLLGSLGLGGRRSTHYKKLVLKKLVYKMLENAQLLQKTYRLLNCICFS